MIDEKREKRKKSIKPKVLGTQERPRINVFRSSKHIYASLIDDKEGKTLLWVSESSIKGEKLPKVEKAFLVGKNLGEKAVKKGFKKAVFDRAGYVYHGRVKKLAEGVRSAGLEF